MSSEKKSDAHDPVPVPEPDAPKPSEGPQKEEQPQFPTETTKDEPKQQAKENTSGPEGLTTATAPPAETASIANSNSESSADSSDSDTPAELEDDWHMHGETPEPESAPCACSCGHCCSHPTAATPLHCVRCHANYTFNHSQACSVPHVYYGYDRDYCEDQPQDVAVRSLCCGSLGGEPIKNDWTQPYPCFVGWHTTDMEAVKEQYNGLNVLRCNPGRSGKCRRARMKHHAYYRNLFDDKISYVDGDDGDRKSHLKRKREELGNRKFKQTYRFVEEAENICEEKMRKGRRY